MIEDEAEAGRFEGERSEKSGRKREVENIKSGVKLGDAIRRKARAMLYLVSRYSYMHLQSIGSSNAILSYSQTIVLQWRIFKYG